MKKILSIIAITGLSMAMQVNADVNPNVTPIPIELGKTYTGVIKAEGGPDCLSKSQFLTFANSGINVGEVNLKLNVHGTNSFRNSDGHDEFASPLKISGISGGSLYVDETYVMKNDYSYNVAFTDIAQNNTTARINTFGADLMIGVSPRNCTVYGGGVDVIYDITLEKPADWTSFKVELKNSDKQLVTNARVNFFTADGNWAGAAGGYYNGVYLAELPKGNYLIEAINENGTSTFRNAPKGDSKLYLTKEGDTVKIVLDDVKPVIDSVAATMIDVKGVLKPGYTVTGSGFGVKRGYVDVGGYLTNSGTYIRSWTDTQIEVVKSSSMPLTGCFKVFSYTAGYSDCVNL